VPPHSPMRSKLALEIQYVGTAYIGWQAQGDGAPGPSIYEAVATALRSIGINSGPVAAGRTDKGVHAMSMWLTVTTRRSVQVCPGAERNVELDSMCSELNQQLPADIRVLQVVDAPLSAHAMTCSSGKTYTYLIRHGVEQDSCHPLANACWTMNQCLDVQAMRAALPPLIGRCDFRALCAVQDPKRSTVRTITHASVHVPQHLTLPLLGCYDAATPDTIVPQCDCRRCTQGHGDDCDDTAAGAVIQLRFAGDGFLKHQCRRIVGLLVRIGRRDESPSAMSEALNVPHQFDRSRAPEAPACGLWLEAVDVEAMLQGWDEASRGFKRANPPDDHDEGDIDQRRPPGFHTNAHASTNTKGAPAAEGSTTMCTTE